MPLGASTVAMVASRSPRRQSSKLDRSSYRNKLGTGDYGEHQVEYQEKLPKRQKTKINLSESICSTPTKRNSRHNRYNSNSSPYLSTPKRSAKGNSRSCDRFIPNRSNFRIDLCQERIFSAEAEDQNLQKSNDDILANDEEHRSPAQTPMRSEFERRMRGALLSVSDLEPSESSKANASNTHEIRVPQVQRMLSFKGESDENIYSKTHSNVDPFQQDQLRVLDRCMMLGDEALNSCPRISKKGLNGWRRIPSGPSRVLDAPELEDDYYLNLLSWGKQNVLAVALGRNVYLWNASNGEIQHLVSLEGADNYVTSVSWAEVADNTHFLSVGTNEGLVQLWDTAALKLVRTMNGHTARVGSLAWNQHLLSSGGRDSLIVNHDVRIREHNISTYRGHLQEVCGLKWNEDGSTLASGGNENYLCLWEAAMSGQLRDRRSSLNSFSPRIVLTAHKAAVKALDFCPLKRHLLSSGGGTADRCIKFWNTNSGTLLNSIDTGSQVCSLLWSRHNKELCSSHGFSENQLILWDYPSMTKIQEFTGHTSRVLHMASSPDGATVVSAAADETLRFWDIFGTPPNNRKSISLHSSLFTERMTTIR